MLIIHACKHNTAELAVGKFSSVALTNRPPNILAYSACFSGRGNWSTHAQREPANLLLRKALAEMRSTIRYDLIKSDN